MIFSKEEREEKDLRGEIGFFFSNREEGKSRELARGRCRRDFFSVLEGKP